MMKKDFFAQLVLRAIDKAIENNKLGELKENNFSAICEVPKNKEFGDFAINVSSLARNAKMAPPLIAQNIAQYIEKQGFEINIVAGFINFKLEKEMLNDIAKEILQKEDMYAACNIGKGEKVNLEYVSANPTGPFHIGHGRWAALGSALANIMNYCGYSVYQEFYINDAGNQINKLARSLELRVKELKGEKVEWEEDLYPGEYLIDCAKRYIASGEKESYGDFAKADMLRLQKELLEKFRTHFDCFFSELSLYKNNEVENCIEELKKKGKLYEKDGAVWFKSSDYTDTQDRVLKKSDGTNTYLTADIAYHKNKLERGFTRLINIWGADHHGYIARMKAAIDALGYDSSCLEVLLGQLVNIIQNGEQMRMGKRKKMVTLDELVEEVGVDATRFWMLMRSSDTTIDFDIDLAKSQSDKNPVFYVQYAHARACSILRKATEKRIDIENKTELEALFSEKEIEEISTNPDIKGLFDDSCDEQSREAARALILKLEESKSIVEAAARLRAPYLLCKYSMELATAFHHFYNFSRVLTDDKEISKKRLTLVKCFRIILSKTLDLLGVEAPQKM